MDVPSWGSQSSAEFSGGSCSSLGPPSCLLCWEPCLKQEDSLDEAGSVMNMPGAEGVASLQRQLSQWFILRKLLDVPAKWCEVNLVSAEEAEGGGWFRVCSECTEGVVADAWEIFTQILDLERRLEELKREVRRRMEECAEVYADREESDEITSSIRMLVGTGIPRAHSELDSEVKTEPETSVLGTESDYAGVCSGGEEEKWRPDGGFDGLSPEEPGDLDDGESEHKDLPADVQGMGSNEDRVVATGEGVDAIDKPVTPKCVEPAKRRKDTRKRKRIRRGKCVECNAPRFLDMETFRRHQSLHQERKLNPGVDAAGQSLDCGQCSFPAVDAQELLEHVIVRHEKSHLYHKFRYECPRAPECPKVPSDSWVKMVAHVEGEHTEQDRAQLVQRYLHCDQCPFQGQMPKHLFLHRRREHRSSQVAPVSLDQVVKCDQCGVLCSTAREMELHVRNEHRRLNRHVCDVCGKGFPHNKTLRNHLATHVKHLSRDHVCEVCGVDFGRRGTLQSHHDKYHSEEAMRGREGMEQFKCRYCNLSSPFNAVIRKHLQTHKQEGEWKCEQCGKFYMNRQGLLRHQRINHNQGGEQVKCPYCNKGYPCKESLQTHQKKHCKLKGIVGSGAQVP